MLIVIGLLVFLAAAAIGVTAVMTNAGQPHLLTDHFEVLGYHVTGSTGTVFLSGMVVGAVAGAGLTVLVFGAQRAATLARALRVDQRSDRRAEVDAPEAPLDSVPTAGEAGEAAETGESKEGRRFGFLGRRSPEKASSTTGAVTSDAAQR